MSERELAAFNQQQSIRLCLHDYFYILHLH
jgi:hypothetical protein